MKNRQKEDKQIESKPDKIRVSYSFSREINLALTRM